MGTKDYTTSKVFTLLFDTLDMLEFYKAHPLQYMRFLRFKGLDLINTTNFHTLPKGARYAYLDRVIGALYPNPIFRAVHKDLDIVEFARGYPRATIQLLKASSYEVPSSIQFPIPVASALINGLSEVMFAPHHYPESEAVKWAMQRTHGVSRRYARSDSKAALEYIWKSFPSNMKIYRVDFLRRFTHKQLCDVPEVLVVCICIAHVQMRYIHPMGCYRDCDQLQSSAARQQTLTYLIETGLQSDSPQKYKLSEFLLLDANQACFNAMFQSNPQKVLSWIRNQMVMARDEG